MHIRAGGCDEASLVMDTIETSTTAAKTVQTTQPEPVHNGGDATLAFFAVGMVINLVMITAYFIWAFRQWKK
jgi:hypothetical protein